MVIRIQSLLDEVGELGELLLKLVGDERPFQADFESRGHLRVLLLAQEMVVEFVVALCAEQVVVPVKLCGDLTLVENRCKKLVQVATTNAASFDCR